mmetsp:Transcript_8662/g.14030  ORF Transcript_8662/g.14030 Transcript_8662/m.14030 type:complete len:296 (-) Transcript_8662:305-1192(-)
MSLQCCYLLTPIGAEHTGRVTYVGYTTNVVRRLRQHNGEIANGAKRTHKHRPWRMVCAVMGFPSKFSALSFEYAWQHPFKARLCASELTPYKRVRGMGTMTSVKRKLIELKVLLAQCKPYQQFPLVVNFEEDTDAVFFKTQHDFPKLGVSYPTRLPHHMEITTGVYHEEMSVATEIFCKEGKISLEDEFSNLSLEGGFEESELKCTICNRIFMHNRAVLECPAFGVDNGCSLRAHPVCLAEILLEDQTALIPKGGDCPLCNKTLSWPRLVRDAKIFEAAEKKTVDSVQLANVPET